MKMTYLLQCARIDDPSGVEPPPCSRGMISSRRPVAPQSALMCANAGPQAIDSVMRVSSRVEFIEAEFNGAGARSPYIQYQVSASDAASRSLAVQTARSSHEA
jgi:hypothetical protein